MFPLYAKTKDDDPVQIAILNDCETPVTFYSTSGLRVVNDGRQVVILATDWLKKITKEFEMRIEGLIKVLLRTTLAALLIGMTSTAVQAQNGFSPMYNSADNVFNNYFTQGSANQATAAAYISPVGVPGWVGHTYITYEPLYPHEFMHHHSHRYHSYYDGGAGLNRTSVHYYSPPARTAATRVFKMIQLPH